MKVYAESNLVLEIAFDQAEASQADRILALAESGEIELVIPSIALVEPFSTAQYRNVDRQTVLDAWMTALGKPKRNRLLDLGLLPAHRRITAAMSQVTNDIADLVAQQSAAVDTVVRRIASAGRLIHTERAAFDQSVVYRADYGLDPVDSLIYATVIHDLQTASSQEPSCFASRNSRDFGNPGISAELASYGSRYISTFANALAYVQSVLAQQGP